MDRLELLERIARGEDSITELKREVGTNANAFANEMIALANAGLFHFEETPVARTTPNTNFG